MKHRGGPSLRGVLLVAAAVLGAAGCEIVPVRETRGAQGPQLVPAETPEEVAAESEETVLAPGAPTDTEIRAMEVFRSASAAVVNLSRAAGGAALLPPQAGTGSGTIVAPEGLVITTVGVLGTARALTVTLEDGSSFQAQVVGSDPDAGLALLSFDPGAEPLTVASLASTADLSVGQMAVALGNPFGLECTLSVGVISGLHRPVRTESGFLIPLMQTDIVIDAGSEGGPLLDAGGAMIGVNVLPAGAPQGVGLAVPAGTVRRVLEDLKRYGEVQRGWIDITAVPVDGSLARRAGLPVTRGLLVQRVPPGSPAGRAGLRGGDPAAVLRSGGADILLGGDVIVGLEGSPVTGLLGYLDALSGTRPGQVVSLTVARGDRTLELSVELSPRPASLPW